MAIAKSKLQFLLSKHFLSPLSNHTFLSISSSPLSSAVALDFEYDNESTTTPAVADPLITQLHSLIKDRHRKKTLTPIPNLTIPSLSFEVSKLSPAGQPRVASSEIVAPSVTGFRSSKH